MNLTRSTVLDAPASRVWEEVKTSRLLTYVAAPLQTFQPIQPSELPEVWHAGEYLVGLKLFGVLPVGRQWVVVSFPEADTTPGRERYQVRDNGHGTIVRTWDHRITIQALPSGRTLYTDAVKVRAGPLTPVIWAFAVFFYRHRQRRWQLLVRNHFRYT